MDQTVNLTSTTSVVRIHLCPPAQDTALKRLFLLYLVFFLCVPLRFTVNNREHEKTFFPKFPQKQKYRFLPLSRPMRDFYLKIKSTPLHGSQYAAERARGRFGMIYRKGARRSARAHHRALKRRESRKTANRKPT